MRPYSNKLMQDYTNLMDRIVRLEMEQSQVLGQLLWNEYSPKSVIDLGCGPGIYLTPFKEQGAKVLGIDICPAGGGYLDDNEFRVLDLRTELDFDLKYELALCIEVGEHLEEQFADVLVNNCCNASDLIFWTAANPTQSNTGVHHVNCQAKEYWINKFETKDMIYDKKTSEKVIGHLDSILVGEMYVAAWIKQNSMIFRRI